MCMQFLCSAFENPNVIVVEFWVKTQSIPILHFPMICYKTVVFRPLNMT